MPYIYNIIDYMKKSKKIWISASAVVVALTALAIGLGIGIPQLLNQQKIDELVKNQVKPSEGNGSYLHSEIKTAAGSVNRDLTIEKVAGLALASNAGYESIVDNQISNYVTEFFKNFKGSDAYAQRYKTWIEEINTEFSDTVKSYKNQHGANWEFYFQVNVLDPVGGNENDWKRNKIFSRTVSAFDEFIFQNYYINAKDQNGNILKATASPTNALLKYLYSADLVNGPTVGTRNNVVFEPDATSASTTPYAKALAKLQEYVFEQYVKENMPLVTSMVLYKHVAPQADGKSNFFNVAKAKKINDVTSTTDVVGTEASYTWQAFDAAQSAIDNPTGSTPSTTTNKFVDFVTKLNAGAFVDATTGAINIPASLYTDDSATLYYIKGNDVFSSSYTQYAAAATYKYNTILGVTDANVPTKTAITTTKLNGKDATEIMNNFMTTSATTTGYFPLPTQVKNIINNDTSYFFEGSYNGIQAIADTINLPATSPFIMTRDEAGVHIIGIDRYSQIKAATTNDGRINEIANTILWRHILGEFGQNTSTGFTLDLKTELKTFFSNNRTKLLFNYITENEVTNPAADEYIFSNNYTDVTSLPKLSESVYFPYITAWINYSEYLEKTKHKATVKEKILGTQTNYLTHIYGNSVINNGIAGVLPYTRNTTANASPTLINKGIVDNTFGTYNSLNIFANGDTTKTYSEVEAQTQLNNITNTIVPTIYNDLNNTQKIGMKSLTYSSSIYNQYFLIGTQTPIKNSSVDYINDGDILNSSVSAWIGLSATKDTVEIEKLVADINYVATDSIYNTNTVALGNSYTNPTTVAAAPALPTTAATDSVKTTYVNWQLQNAYDQIKKIPTVTGSLKDIANNGTTYANLTALARNTWAKTYLANTTSGTDTYSLLKEIAALKYAFDYNETTTNYDFTKFRDYLLNQTSNYGKGAFVWQASDKIDLISGYAASGSGIANHFTYQPNNITKNAGAYGYAYQGANNVSTYRDATTGMWKSDVTFSNKASYYNATQLEYATSGGKVFNGYLGMQLENSTSSELVGQIKTDLFSGNANVYVGYDAATATGAPQDSTIDIQGVLYNYYDRAEFVKAINTQIYSWQQVNALANWFGDTFGIDVSTISRTSISSARSELVKIAEDNTKLPDGVFTRNKNALLVNSTVSVMDPAANKAAPYYYEESEGYYASAVFTQFNYLDVVKLFDTNKDGNITSDDTGINWDEVTNSGFLGVGADSFFLSAFNWYTNQASAKTNAYDNVLTRQGKVYVYDRRLNDQLGRVLVENYKENKTGQ